MVNLDSAILPAIGLISATIAEFNAFPFSPGFDIKKGRCPSSRPPHPLLGIWDNHSSPPRAVQPGTLAKSVRLGSGYAALDRGNGAAGADDTIKGLLEDVPRYWNGAISHRANTAELWADFMYMVPPYLAYYAADKQDEGLLRESVRQCQLYRAILQLDTDEPYKGAWRHIIGPESQDTGLWSTGNAWAAAGMTRVLATVNKSSFVTNGPLAGKIFRIRTVDKESCTIREPGTRLAKGQKDPVVYKRHLACVYGR
ncbi:hypothetical protein NLJ89_g9466 [Agrocybe chaxingu]|uniref:Uncharacterized protein n=1 Tax=Agrocybe chaxingu TaxID=84603 RepID=A0A9W8JSN4_9AGAR|nr:hypothetical protein NLJ89_g9466 [Agrocybe chaxingu]